MITDSFLKEQRRRADQTTCQMIHTASQEVARVKISPRTVLKIARLYGLADDTTPLKALRHLTVATTPSYISASFTLATQQYQLLYDE